MRDLWTRHQTVDQIAFFFNCTTACVVKWTRRFAQEGENAPVQDLRCHNGGRYKISDADLQNITNVLRENPFQAVKRLPRALNLNVHEQTIRRNLNKRSNLYFHKAAKKVAILQPDHNARIAYANANLRRTEAQWQRTVFMDEKVFSSSKDGKH